MTGWCPHQPVIKYGITPLSDSQRAILWPMESVGNFAITRCQ